MDAKSRPTGIDIPAKTFHAIVVTLDRQVAHSQRTRGAHYSAMGRAREVRTQLLRLSVGSWHEVGAPPNSIIVARDEVVRVRGDQATLEQLVWDLSTLTGITLAITSP